MTSLDLDHIRASALRQPHKTGAEFQVFPSRYDWRRIAWAALPSLFGAGALLLLCALGAGL